MTYKVELRRTAQRGLDALPERDYKAIAKVISSLAREPRPPRVKKLAESGLWRIRIKQYRVIYAVDDEAKLVTVARIARRKEDTYKNL